MLYESDAVGSVTLATGRKTILNLPTNNWLFYCFKALLHTVNQLYFPELIFILLPTSFESMLDKSMKHDFLLLVLLVGTSLAVCKETILMKLHLREHQQCPGWFVSLRVYELGICGKCLPFCPELPWVMLLCLALGYAWPCMGWPWVNPGPNTYAWPWVMLGPGLCLTLIY